MSKAESIRIYGKREYVLPARKRGDRRFSIRAGDVVRALGLHGRTPAVCSALKTRRFLSDNRLRLIARSGPESGQSTTVVFTYEFIEDAPGLDTKNDSWIRLRGALKDIFADLGGGEAYLRAERSNFYGPKGDK
jgi:hypothetical protein